MIYKKKDKNISILLVCIRIIIELKSFFIRSSTLIRGVKAVYGLYRKYCVILFVKHDLCKDKSEVVL